MRYHALNTDDAAPKVRTLLRYFINPLNSCKKEIIYKIYQYIKTYAVITGSLYVLLMENKHSSRRKLYSQLILSRYNEENYLI